MNETRNTSHKEHYLLYCLCRDVDPEPPLVHAVELGGQAALGREGEVLPELEPRILMGSPDKIIDRN